MPPPPSRIRAGWWVALGLLVAAAAGGLAYQAWPILFPSVTAAAPLDPDCDLRAGPCSGRLPGGGTVRFGIEPKAIPVLKPLTLTVRLEGVEARGVEVDFAGTDMNMGYNRVALRGVVPGLWRGEGMLPICVRDVMSWEAKVLLDTAEGRMAAPFRFDAYSR